MFRQIDRLFRTVVAGFFFVRIRERRHHFILLHPSRNLLHSTYQERVLRRIAGVPLKLLLDITCRREPFPSKSSSVNVAVQA